MKDNVYIFYRKSYLKFWFFFSIFLLVLLVHPFHNHAQQDPLSLLQSQGLGLNIPSKSAPGGFSGNDLLEDSGSDRPSLPFGNTREAFSASSLNYQVHVLGEVKSPGTYRVAPTMRLTDAIQFAQGIKDNGSERFVELKKQGQSHGIILDLFAYKTLGNLSQNPYLQDNDTIFIPLKTKAVEIEGPIRRPGIYELKNEKNLAELVKLAGNFTVGASLEEPIRIIRYHGNQEKEILEVSTNTDDMAQFDLQDGDVIVVSHKFLTKHQFDYNIKKLPNDNIFYPAYDDKVFVIGGVKAPGAFQFNQYYSLRQYMTLAGGTTIMAKQGKIRIVRPDGTTVKTPRGQYNGMINPGDTIVVPEKSIPDSFYISLMTTIASIGVSSVAIFR